MNESVFTNAFSALNRYATAVKEYYQAEAIANKNYAGAAKESAIADAAAVLQTAANRTGAIVADAITKAIDGASAAQDLPESVFSAGTALGNANLTPAVAVAIVRVYGGNGTALQYLHDVAHANNKPYVESFIVDVDALTTAKANMALIVDSPAEASTTMHAIRQELRKAASCYGFTIEDHESEDYVDLRFKAMSIRAGLID